MPRLPSLAPTRVREQYVFHQRTNEKKYKHDKFALPWAQLTETLVEFRAGRLFREGTTVKPDTRKGLISVKKNSQSEIHFTWMDRKTQVTEVDILVKKRCAVIERIPQCKNSFAFLIKIGDSNLFFWMQEPEEVFQIECLQKLNNYISSAHLRSTDESDSDIDEDEDEDDDMDGDDDGDVIIGPNGEILFDLPLFNTRPTQVPKDPSQTETESLGSFILRNEEEDFQISENSLFEEIRRTLQQSIEDSLLSFEEYEEQDGFDEEDEDEQDEDDENEEVDKLILRFGSDSGLVEALSKLEEKVEEKKHVPEVLPSVIDSPLRKLWFEKLKTHLQENQEQIEKTSPELNSTALSNFEGIACGLEMNAFTTCRGTRTIYKSKMITVARDIDSKTKAGQLFVSEFRNCGCKPNQKCDCRRTCICFETTTSQ